MMPTDSFTYFAYGSNMATGRLRARTPSARSLGRAYATGWRLNFHKLALDGSAKCSISHTGCAQDRVYGVLYSIERAQQVALDQAEGLGFAYRAELISVVPDGGTTADQPSLAAPVPSAVKALAYIALSLDETAVPYDWYKQFVVAGAIEHGLPAAQNVFTVFLQIALESKRIRCAAKTAVGLPARGGFLTKQRAFWAPTRRARHKKAHCGVARFAHTDV